MIGPLIYSVARTAAPTLTKVFVREVIRAAGYALGVAAVGGVARVVRDRYEYDQQQQKALPYNNDRGWRR